MNSDTLNLVTWRKSSFSGASGGSDECVEVAALANGNIAVRDSKHPHGTILTFPRSAMTAFLHGVKHHEFDDLTPGCQSIQWNQASKTV